MQTEMVDRFFAWARERENIRLKRAAGEPPPWTQDNILGGFRFTNVYREDDRNTIWFRENIRENLRNDPAVLFATVFFRWFNRIETAERLLDADGISRLGVFREFKPDVVRAKLSGINPIVTAAYIIKTPNGRNKLEGLLWCFEQFWNSDAREWIHSYCTEAACDLQSVHAKLTELPFLGGFMAYEIVTDLRHTYLLENACDVKTWANAGPGCMRGLNRIWGRPVDKIIPQKQACEELQRLLEKAPDYGWHDWEMRETENGMCELDKYERARLGEGRPKQLYRPK
jgi:hypothetical protein